MGYWLSIIAAFCGIVWIIYSLFKAVPKEDDHSLHPLPISKERLIFLKRLDDLKKVLDNPDHSQEEKQLALTALVKAAMAHQKEKRAARRLSS